MPKHFKSTHGLLRLIILTLAAICLAAGAGFAARSVTYAVGDTYKVLAWNDLGMHCYNKDFSNLAVLPPYNTLWVQVIKMGEPPTIVTSGITVEYSYADNTYSVGKTNFWTYAKALFGADLPDNIGLKGKGLSGTMDLVGDHYVAEGIPITEFSDSAPAVRQPYQVATVLVKDATTGVVLSSINVVTPTSSEMRCDTCHSDSGIAKPATPTGKVETNILQLHDEEEGTGLIASQPVLCATCHGSNALGLPGNPDLPNLSNAMHGKHKEIIPDTLDGCYNCHPGPQTRCMRDVMSQDGMTCINCHKGMATVATNPDPWLNEPRCDSCHDSGPFQQDQALYRFSKGHGGLYCESCHDSTHAVAPSREANDAIKFITLQGQNGPLEECAVCHTGSPDPDFGPHQNINAHMLSGNTGMDGVTLKYSVSGKAKIVTSDIQGNYTIPVPNAWSGTVTPSKTGYVFSPVSRTYTNVTANQDHQNYSATTSTTATLTSNGKYDGWVLESGFNTNKGGSLNATATTFQLGDDARNRQYRAILSFDTSILPAGAVIQSARLRIRQSGKPTGSNPFTALGSLQVDIKTGSFGLPTLQIIDFQAPYSLKKAGTFGKTPASGWYSTPLSAAGLAKINRTGVTQFRLYFSTKTNNNLKADFMKFFSGNNSTYKPELIIVTVP